MQVFDEENSPELVETSLLLDVQERVEAFPPGGCDLFRFCFPPFPLSCASLKSFLLLGNPALLSQAIWHFSGHIFVVFSLRAHVDVIPVLFHGAE